MKCRECGTEIAAKALICFRCGASVEEPLTQPHVPAQTKTPLVIYAVLAIAVVVATVLMWLQ